MKIAALILICSFISKITLNLAAYCCSKSNCASCTNASICDVCDTGYYKQGANCQPCLPQCIACSASNVCTACPDGQYLSGSTCYPCLSPCSKCINSNSQCTDCIAGYLLSGSTCQVCTKPCIYCSSSLTTCTTCVDPTNQSIPSCDCTSPAKYLHPTSFTCLTCISPCLNCSSATSCDSCVATYFLSGTTCTACTKPCANCTGTATNCTSCIDTLQTGSTCACPSSYFMDNTTKLCVICTYPCVTCQNLATYCTSCASTYTYDSISHVCNCLTTQFELSGSPNTCQSCISPCLTCSTSSTHCTSCITGINRHLSANQCVCDTGYSDVAGTCSACAACGCTQYLDSSSVCQSCTSPCYSCNTTATTCTSCISNHYLSGSSCPQCTSPCLNCIDNATKCLSCVNSLTLSSNQCICSDGFYMDSSYNCQPCTYPCTKCVDNATKCLDCATTYIINVNTCQCPTGFYEDLSNTPKNCQSCILPCLTCQLNASHCLTCNDPNQFIDAINQCQCLDGYYSTGSTCIACQSPCSKCQINATSCTECINPNFSIINNTCGCSNGQTLVGLTCLQCISNCQQCSDSTTCLQCFDGYYITDSNQCQCADGYYEQLGSCQACDSTCLTCSIVSNNCLSCDQQLNRILKGNKCDCFANYFENQSNQCISCQSEEGKIVESCKYSDCNDSVWTYGEECDDGNNVVRDGCSYCKIDNKYSCENQILQKSLCFQCSPNCEQCHLNNECIKCSEGYFLDQSKCAQCSDICLNCKKSSSNCIDCRFKKNKLTGECLLCEQIDGYYTDFTTKTCRYICGDSIKAQEEECDDGNLLNGDGCDKSCRQENQFICKDGVCIIPQYPIPYLSILGKANLYDNLRQFKLEYDLKLKVSSDLNISSLLSLFIVKEDNISQIYYPYSIFEDLIKDDHNFTKFSATISIILNKTSSEEILQLEFKNTSRISSFEGYQQQETQVRAQIMKFIQISNQTITQVEAVVSSNSYILYALCAMAGIAILFGGIDIFYNLLDTLQMLSYLKYVNTQMPYNLQSFFDFFGFAQLSFVSKFLNLQALLNLDESKLEKIPQKIANDQYNSLYIINVTSIIVVWLTSIGTYITAKFILNYIDLHKPRYYADYLEVDEWVIKLRLYYLSFKVFLAKLSHVVVSELIFSGIIRIQISTAYDYLFSVFLQIFALQLSSEDVLVCFSSYLAIFAFVIYLLTVYFVVNYSHFGNQIEQSKHLQQKYGAIYEGVKKNMYSKYFNSFLLIKKAIFMCVLIFLYSMPIYQAANLTLIMSISSIYLIFIQPLEEKLEFYKQASCEINTFLTLILLYALVIDDEICLLSEQSRSIIGWCAIVLITAILLIQLTIDAYQQWILLLQNYASLRRIYKRFQKLLGQSQIKPAEHKVLELVK